MRRLLGLAAAVLAAASLLPAGPAASADETDRRPGDSPHSAMPLVIGHRGASGYRPEHTLASYRVAIRQGADYIEPDLVSTKDHVLVARHENDITGTTDVAQHPEFADRKTTKVIDGRSITGWFTEDFTLAELRTLRAVERLPDVRPGNTAYNGKFRVPTLQQVIDLVKAQSARTGRQIGIYPETKHPTYFDSIGLSLEEPLVATLRANGLAKRTSPVFIQSFEMANLRQLNRMINVPLVQLLDSPELAPYDTIAAGAARTYASLATAAGLREIARYADGVGPYKEYVIPRNADGTLGEPTTFVRDAHRAGLVVHAWTFRAENTFLPTEFRSGDDPTAHGDLAGEITAYLDAGLDGFFTDFPDLGVAARNAFVRSEHRDAA